MYSAILLNFLIALYFYSRYKGDSTILLAMTVTLIADYFLTYKNSNFLVGVACFCLVQIIYGWKLRYRATNLLFRILGAVFVAWIMIFLEMDFYESILCGLSMGLLLGNVIISFRHWSDSRKQENLIFFLGLLLFLGCDLSIGLRNISAASENLKVFYDIMNYTTWTCYLPSQVLLNCTYLLQKS